MNKSKLFGRQFIGAIATAAIAMTVLFSVSCENSLNGMPAQASGVKNAVIDDKSNVERTNVIERTDELFSAENIPQYTLVYGDGEFSIKVILDSEVIGDGDTIESALDMVKTHAAGADCAIYFGNREEGLHIGQKNIIFDGGQTITITIE